jgi:hypothetical protein
VTVATHRVEVVPVRHKMWDDDLQTWVLRTIGARYVCDCGDKGQVRALARQAKADGWLHAEGKN